MPSPGSLLLKARQKYGHGIRTAYFRDRVRPRILNTPPIDCGSSSDCEIHVFTSADDWLNLLWALKTFLHYSERAYGLCIHDDGTLGAESIAALERHFRGARVIVRRQADQEIEEALHPYPRCRRFRKTNHLAPKLLDFLHYLTRPRLLLIDSDVLFFHSPVELLRRCEDAAYALNTLNPDVNSAYTVSFQDAQDRCGVSLHPRLNSGLGLIHRESIRLDWIEEFLALPGIDGHFWRMEQTLYALCSSRFGVELLPDEYAVRLDGGLEDRPCRHYVGAIRHLMYSEGVCHLARNGFLESFRCVC